MKWLNNLLRDAAPDGDNPRESDGAPIRESVEPVLDDSPLPSDLSAYESVDDPLPQDPLADLSELLRSASQRLAEHRARLTTPAPDFLTAQSQLRDDLQAEFRLLQAMLESMDQRQREASQKLADLQQLYETRIHVDVAQNKAFDRLVDQLRDAKTNQIRQERVPLLKDVISCHDFVATERQRFGESASDARTAEFLRTLDHLAQMLVDVLFKYDVEPYRGETDTFDRARQVSVSTVPTDASTDDKKIQSRGLLGFQSPDGILRREHVVTYRYRPAAPTTAMPAIAAAPPMAAPVDPPAPIEVAEPLAERIDSTAPPADVAQNASIEPMLQRDESVRDAK